MADSIDDIQDARSDDELDQESPVDPKENPIGTGHLPVSGEVGVGPVPYHDPVTTDTNDDPVDEPSVEDNELN